MSKYYTVVTDTGLSALAGAVQEKSFSLTKAVVGDGDGSAIIPNKAMTTLVNQVWIGDISGIKTDSSDPDTLIFEFAIPADSDGFTIREVGLLDSEGQLFCVGNFPETVKPVAEDGSVRDLVVRLPLHFENADVVNLVVNAAVALATKQDLIDHNDDPQAHRRATEEDHGFTQYATPDEHKAKTVRNRACTPFGVWELIKSLMSSSVTSSSTDRLATPKAVKTVQDNLNAHNSSSQAHRHATENVAGFTQLAKAEEHLSSSSARRDIAATPYGVWNLLTRVRSDAVDLSSTWRFATSKAVKTVMDALNGHTSASDPHNAQSRVDSKMQGHLHVNDPHGVVAKVKALLSSSTSSTSTTNFATPKAVKTVNDSLKAHKNSTAVHIPSGGSTGEVLIKQANGDIAWGAVAGVPVGQLCFSTNGEALAGTIPVNVKQKVLCTAYPQLFEWMKGGNYLRTESAWDAEAAAQDGTCGKYCWDGGDWFILPCYTRYFAAAHVGKAAGSWDGDAIRNIEGEFEGGHSNSPSLGAFYRNVVDLGEWNGIQDIGTGTKNDRYSFDVSRVVPTAEENRPKTSYVLPCIKAFDVPVNAAHVDMQALAQQVAAINGNKVDRSELLNSIPTMVVEDRRDKGVNGGTFTAGAFRLRDLNHVQYNSIFGASLSNNQITLMKAGCYFVHASVPATVVRAHQAVLTESKTNTILLYGTTINATEPNGPDAHSTSSVIQGVINVSAPLTIDIRHICSATKSNIGFGCGLTFAADKAIFTQVVLCKLS